VLVGGAYFGDQAVLIARQIRDHGGVCHAFEPNPQNCRMLERNAALNRLPNLRINPVGLWDDDASRLRLVGDDALAFSEVATGPDSDGFTFPTTTVDRYVEREGVPEVDLIMVDVEGAEFRVLRGAVAQLAKPDGAAPDLVFEVHRHYVDWTDGLHNTEVVRFLRGFGYTVFAVRDFQANHRMAGQPVELVRPEETYLEGPPHGFNMVAVKAPSALQGEGFRLCRGVSPKLLAHKDPALHHPAGGL
jgi:FkbM family methyltransferase